MKNKPKICVIDEDELVQKGWQLSLKNDAELCFYKNHLELFRKSASNSNLIPSFHCIILARHYPSLKLDVTESSVAETLKARGAGPVFLNWQGYISKEQLDKQFDGKMFHKYGVRWQTLRLRILKTGKHLQKSRKPKPITKTPAGLLDKKGVTRPERCSALLRAMAEKADGQHKEKIEFYASKDTRTGIMLLEAIYNELITDKNRPPSCPSRYINSSPVIAKRILQETLYN